MTSLPTRKYCPPPPPFHTISTHTDLPSSLLTLTHSQRTLEGVVTETGGGTGMIVRRETGGEEEEREALLHMEEMGMMETATVRGEGEEREGVMGEGG